MNGQPPLRERRILIVDDNRAIHGDFIKVLGSPGDAASEFAAAHEALFGEATDILPTQPFVIDSAYQGAEGFAHVQQSVAAGRPYAVAFVDVRMPPGWDGVETIVKIWEIDPDIQIVLCTAYSDYSWEELIAKIGQTDRLLILKKPFESVEVLQLANALAEKWNLLQIAKVKVENLEKLVVVHRENEERTRRALEREHQLVEIKTAFVTMVSHEFRTPLGVINAATHLLDRYLERMTAEQRTEKINDIQGAVERMTGMMEDFLIHGELQAGKLECKPAPLDLAALCRQLVAEAAHSRGSARRIECAVDAAVQEVCLDGKILHYILGNLLSNAVKYSDEGPIHLAVRRITDRPSPAPDAAGRGGDHVLLKVSDAGIGIPSTDLARLFETFHRAANVGQRPGTGMGLAIVKQCVDVHGGTISVESQEGRGTTFQVTLPIAASPFTSAPSTSLPNRQLSSPGRTPENLHHQQTPEHL